MKTKRLLVSTALTVALLLAGCGESGEEADGTTDSSGGLPSDYSGLMDAYTATFDSLTETLEGLKSEADAKAIGEELKSQLNRLQEIQSKLGKITPEQSPETAEKSMAMMEAMNRFNATVGKMMQDPAFAKSLQEAMQQVAGQQ